MQQEYTLIHSGPQLTVQNIAKLGNSLAVTKSGNKSTKLTLTITNVAITTDYCSIPDHSSMQLS